MSDRILLDFEGDRREIADYEAAGGYESLKRALAIRQVLIDDGVSPDRIDVRAMRVPLS